MHLEAACKLFGQMPHRNSSSVSRQISGLFPTLNASTDEPGTPGKSVRCPFRCVSDTYETQRGSRRNDVMRTEMVELLFLLGFLFSASQAIGNWDFVGTTPEHHGSISQI